MTTTDLSQIDEKIHRLKKKREKLQTQQSLFFTKEIQKIFKEDFSFDIVLSILGNAWNSASEIQKKEWKRNPSSCCLSSRNIRKETESGEPTAFKS